MEMDEIVLVKLKQAGDVHMVTQLQLIHVGRSFLISLTILYTKITVF
jgi:hypothetical protein